MLRVPTEIRLKIFNSVFSPNGTARYGFDMVSEATLVKSINDVPATCSKFRDETQYAMSQITFDFRNPEKFLDFFMRTRRDMHSKIRNITVKAFPFPMYPSKSASSYITWDFSNVLPFVRGLRLDRLTVFDCFHDPDTNDGWGDMATYHLIDGLVSADGWKELHVVSPTAEFLQWGDPATSNEAFSSTRRKAQPDQWNETLRTKDDNKLGSFVKLYRESKVGTGTERAELCVAVFQPEGKGIEVDTRSDVEILTTLENAASDGIAPDNRSNNIAWSRYNNPYPDKRRGREYRVIARRCASVDCTQTGKDLERELKRTMNDYGWDGILNNGLILESEDDPCVHL